MIEYMKTKECLMVYLGRALDDKTVQECGKCANACPQHIAIPQELKKVNSTLGGLRTKILMPIVRMMFSAEVKE